jgi:hypothetical protein
VELDSSIKELGWNKIVHSQTKEVIYVFKFMMQEAKWDLFF